MIGLIDHALGRKSRFTGNEKKWLEIYDTDEKPSDEIADE